MKRADCRCRIRYLIRSESQLCHESSRNTAQSARDAQIEGQRNNEFTISITENFATHDVADIIITDQLQQIVLSLVMTSQSPALTESPAIPI